MDLCVSNTVLTLNWPKKRWTERSWVVFLLQQQVPVRSIDAYFVGKRPIRIGWGDANTQRYCVHIQFDADAAENLTEDSLREVFGAFGDIVSVILPRRY